MNQDTKKYTFLTHCYNSTVNASTQYDFTEFTGLNTRDIKESEIDKIVFVLTNFKHFFLILDKGTFKKYVTHQTHEEKDVVKL